MLQASNQWKRYSRAKLLNHLANGKGYGKVTMKRLKKEAESSREAVQLSKIDRDYQKKISAIAGVGSKTKHQAFFITQNNPKQYDKDAFVQLIEKMQKEQNDSFVSANALYNAFQNNEHLCFGPKYGSMHVDES